MTGTAVDLIWLPPALALLGFVLNGTLALTRPTAKPLVSGIGAGVLLAAFAASIAVFSAFVGLHADEPVVLRYWSWIPVGTLQVDVALQVDQLSLVMLLVVAGVGSLIHLFSIGYMKEDPGYARYFAYLNLFVFFLLVLVLGASFPVMFVGWEGVGRCSYLLIGFWFSEKANADAGRKAFIMNRIGDFGFMVAMFMIFWATGSLDFGTVFAHAPTALVPGGTAVTAITLFLFLGCTGKSAQIPLYTWLPDAMAGPTPVSALIHAATMVTAGVYLVARCNLLFAMAPVSSAVVAGVGALTALFAATIALKQWDIKRVLAYSTVSQLGYMFLAVGTGAISAGIFHLATHAFFKALLFLGSGSVIYAMHHAYHATHSHEDAQDMRNMGGLSRYMPWTTVLMWIATLAIAGIPVLSGFFSQDELLTAAFARGRIHPEWLVFWGFGVAAALLTAFYMTRLMLYTFYGPNRTGEQEQSHLHEAPWIMTGPLVVLGVLSAVGGILNVPALYHGGEWLHHWLEPVVHPGAALLPEAQLSSATEWMLVGIAVATAIVGMVGAWRLLRPQDLVPARSAPEERGFARVLRNKWYVDEIYDALIVRPIVWLSREVLWKQVDQRVIDGAAVNGAARGARALGWANRWLQTGQVGMYVAVFVVGVLLLSILGSWSYITKREGGFYALLLVLTTGMIGVFVSLDLFLFYVMWEVMLIPMYFIIGVWGGDNRLYAAIKFFIYTFFGSLLMLVAILVLYLHAGRETGVYSFGYMHLLSHVATLGSIAWWLFAAFFLAFAIKVPLFPLHTWLPDAHVEAPTAGSVILAGVLLKMGTYGIVRFCLPMFPEATRELTPLISLLAVVGIVYGALVAMVQTDIKKLV